MAAYFSYTLLSSLLIISIVSLVFLGSAVHAINSSVTFNDGQNTRFVIEDDIPLAKTIGSIIADKCRKAVGNDKDYVGLAQRLITAAVCVKEINFVNIVLSENCQTGSKALECLGNFVHEFKDCLEEDEKKTADSFLRIVEGIINFVCSNDSQGNRVTHFIAEGGLKCLESKMEHIQTCITKNFGEYLKMTSLPKLTIGPKQCDEINAFSDCVIAELKTCDNYTSADMVNSMLGIIKTETSCQKSNDASPNLPGILTLSIVAFAMLFAIISINLRI